MSAPDAKSKINAAAIRILLIRLSACEFSVNDDFTPEEGRALTFDYEYGIERLQPSPDRGLVRLQVAAFQDAENAPFKVRIQYEGFFEVDRGQEDGLRTYLKYNAAATLLPYIRETLSSVTARAGFPPLVLPPVNVVALVKQLDAAATATESEASES